MGIKVRISSPDKEYIDKIVGKLVSRMRRDISLEFITDEKAFVASRTALHRVNVEFVDEAFMNKASGKNVADVTFLIGEHINTGLVVNKIEGSEAILRILGDEVLKDTDVKRKCQIVAVSSPYGGSGKTITALSIAARLSQMNRKVLYIDAENMQNYYEKLDAGKFMLDYASKDLAAAVINLTSDSYEKIKKNIVHGEFDYLPAFEKYLFHYHLTPAMLNSLAHTFAAKGEYDYVIVEQECAVTPELLQDIMDDTRHVVVTNRPLNDSRLKKYLDLFEGYGGYTVIVQTEAVLDDDLQYITMPLAERISLDLDCDMGEILEKGYYRKAAEAVL